MRRLIGFFCAGATLAGTLDEATGMTGLLVVSGGNELRIGAHRGMALLADAVAAAGNPVLRYDRRGIGDSDGENRGFISASDDLTAAVAAFRVEAPHVGRVVGFGNCDAASTLALFGRTAGVDALLLANPWTIDAPDDLPPTAAIRARYRARLAEPGQWRRLMTGGVDLRLLARGLGKILRPPRSAPLARRVTDAIADWGADATVLLATNDATAQAFAAAAPRLAARAERVDTGSHSFARIEDQAALLAAVLRALA